MYSTKPEIVSTIDSYKPFISNFRIPTDPEQISLL